MNNQKFMTGSNKESKDRLKETDSNEGFLEQEATKSFTQRQVPGSLSCRHSKRMQEYPLSPGDSNYEFWIYAHAYTASTHVTELSN